jgi:hypothetical protein
MKKIIVDIDGVLTLEHKGWDYDNRTPDKKNIDELNRLHKMGYEIRLFSSRRGQEIDTTLQWLYKHKILFHSLILNKPNGDVLIDDRSLPFIQGGLDEWLNYKMGGTCWRFKHGEIKENELHTCFFCGHDIEVTVSDCEGCGIVACPKCKRCLCNIPLITYITVKRIHRKYCCNLPNFIGEIELDGVVDMNVVKHCRKTLKTCAEREGFFLL